MNLICYLSNGYPSIKDSIKMADIYLESGCDIIEIDFPSRNPYLDSPFIQQRMKNALEKCSDYTQYMQGMEEIRKNNPEKNFIILVYEETLEEISPAIFIPFCLKNNFVDVIYIGSSNMALRAQCMESGLKISTYIPFNLPAEQLQIAQNANGFIYMQAKSRGENHPSCPTLEKCIKYLRREAAIAPHRLIYCGVGVNTVEDIRYIKSCGADGVFIGSTVLKLHNNPQALKQCIRDMKNAAL